MPIRPIDRLLFEQGGRCFFCQQSLSAADASVEHLVATSNGGGNDAGNCVACCAALNALFGRMSLKEKLRVVLNQKGEFKCPNGTGSSAKSASSQTTADRLALVVADLRKRGPARPRTVKTLIGTISALFKKQLAEQEVAALLGELQARGIVSVSGTTISYELPPSST